MSISVLILTRNEERNLPQCLESVAWSDDIVVLDSFSTDRTLDIARHFGARVFQRVFDTEQHQRTASLQLPFRYPWVFNPDADELTPADLRDEMLTAVHDNRGEVAYRVRFKNMFMGRWIKYSSLYPTWIVRLFQPSSLCFERHVNLTYKVTGPTGRLTSHLIHNSFNNGLEAWFDKHNRYSTGEALESLAALQQTLRLADVRDLLSLDPVRRRWALKALSAHVPCRSASRFFYMYVLRRGFLDGRAGLTYCRLLAIYEELIALKVFELRLARERATT